MTLAHHEHICSECEQATIHHIWHHESEGDTVTFWCTHCEKDVQGTIGSFQGHY